MSMPMNQPLTGAAAQPDVEARLILSALCDGEVALPEAKAACALWRTSAQARADWHTWALIGDALRAESLCVSADHDAAFVARLRERLAQEPVVLAPAPLSVQAQRPASVRWAGVGAVAAGLAVVAGAVVMLRTQPQGGDAALLAATDASSTPVARAVPQPANPALAGYLDAHRQYAPAAMPGGVRQVSLQPQQP